MEGRKGGREELEITVQRSRVGERSKGGPKSEEVGHVVPGMWRRTSQTLQ